MDFQEFWNIQDNQTKMYIQVDSDEWDEEYDRPIQYNPDIPFNTDNSDFVGITDFSDLSYEPVKSGVWRDGYYSNEPYNLDQWDDWNRYATT